MQAVRHTDVGYKLIAVKVELLSHSGRIYMDSLQQKQAILCLSNPYLAIFLMRDTFYCPSIIPPLFSGGDALPKYGVAMFRVRATR